MPRTTTAAIAAAVILCGGQSQRMGRPKAWLPFGPELLLQRVVRIASLVCHPVIVVAAPGQSLPELPREVTVFEDPIAHRGPLQGLATGFAALSPSENLAYVTATDVPFLEPGWITYLANQIGEADLAIAHIGGRYHPLSALYRPRTALPAIHGLLSQDRLRPIDLVPILNTRIMSEADMKAADPALGTLENLNSPEDYLRALRAAGFASA